MNKKLYVCSHCGMTHFKVRKPKKCRWCKRVFADSYELKSIVLK